MSSLHVGPLELVKTVMLENEEKEEVLLTTLQDLDRSFSILMVAVRSALDHKLQHQQLVLVDFIRWIEHRMKWVGQLSDITDLNDLFVKLHPYFDFIDCWLIVNMSEEFLNDESFGEEKKSLISELKEYVVKATSLRCSSTVKELKVQLKTIYSPYLTNLSNMPQIQIELNNPWNEATIEGLYLLIGHLLPFKSKQSILKYIEIETGSVHIKYIVHESNADCLIAYAQSKVQFMHLIGIFGLTINGEPIFKDDENKNFTFDTAILEAAKVDHVEAIQFLIELGTNTDDALSEAAKHGHTKAVCLLLEFGASINHQSVESKTPLMLATLGGHEQVVQTLVSAGADVYIQDNNNYTALTIACEMNSYTLCNYLLQQRKVHETPFTTACRHVCSNVICLLQRISSYISINSSDKIVADIRMLDQKFGSLISTIKEKLLVMIKNGSCKLVTIVQHIEEYTEERGLTKVTTIDELFNKIKSHYHFLNCHLIEHLVQCFFSGNVLQNRVKEYLDEVIAFEESAKLRDIQNASDKTHLSKQDVTEPTCEIIIKLNVIWKQMTLKSLHILINHIFAEKGKHLNHIHIEHESLCITFLVPNSQYHTLKDMAVTKRDFLYQVGIYEMYIDNHPVILKYENDNFTFEPSLLQAAKYGLVNDVELLLKLGARVNYQCEERRAEINEVDIVSMTQFIKHEKVHHLRVEPLCKQQAISNIQEENGWTALMISSVNGHYQVAELLLKQEADPNIQLPDGRTALYLASERDHYQVVELLLKRQVNLNIQDETGGTALMIASQKGHYQVVELLLNEQVNPNIQLPNGGTALYLASQEGHYRVVELLLKEEADPNIQDQTGATALMIASQNGHYQVVALLLKEQADPNIQLPDGRTALYLASENGHYQVMELLLKQQANPNFQNQNGQTALMIASAEGHYQVVELLLKEKANPNIQLPDGQTALYIASAEGHYEVVELLLKQEADPNIQDQNGQTALMIASAEGHYQVVELLLKEKANPNIQLPDGQTALYIASAEGHYQVVELLLKQEADPNIQDQNGQTALMIASAEGHYQVVETLLNQQANSNIQSNYGITALYIASQNFHYQVVELLRKENANPKQNIFQKLWNSFKN